MLIGLRQLDNAQAVRVQDLSINSLTFQETLQTIPLLLKHTNMKWRVAVQVFRVRQSAVAEEIVDYFPVVRKHCEVKWCKFLGVGNIKINIFILIDQILDNFEAAELGCNVDRVNERRQLAVIRSQLLNLFEDRQVVRAGCKVDWLPIMQVSCTFYIFHDQLVDCSLLIALDCKMKRCIAFVVSGVEIHFQRLAELHEILVSLEARVVDKRMASLILDEIVVVGPFGELDIVKQTEEERRDSQRIVRVMENIQSNFGQSEAVDKVRILFLEEIEHEWVALDLYFFILAVGCERGDDSVLHIKSDEYLDVAGVGLIEESLDRSGQAFQHYLILLNVNHRFWRIRCFHSQREIIPSPLVSAS